MNVTKNFIHTYVYPGKSKIISSLLNNILVYLKRRGHPVTHLSSDLRMVSSSLLEGCALAGLMILPSFCAMSHRLTSLADLGSSIGDGEGK